MPTEPIPEGVDTGLSTTDFTSDEGKEEAVREAGAPLDDLKKGLEFVNPLQGKICQSSTILIVILLLGMEYGWPGFAAGGIATGTELLKNFTWVTTAGLKTAGELSNALTVDMDFMISNDEASSVANPRVLASEGKEALISVMTEEYFKILTEDYYQRSTLEKVETGIQLKLTPRIGANDEITLDIETEVSDVISRGDDDLPVITPRIMESTPPNLLTIRGDLFEPTDSVA